MSKYKLKKQDLNRTCPQAMRYDIGVMIVAWKTTKEHFQFPKENLVAKGETNGIEEDRRSSLLRMWDQVISRATYSQYMDRFHHQRRYDLMHSLCTMVKLLHPVTAASGL